MNLTPVQARLLQEIGVIEAAAPPAVDQLELFDAARKELALNREMEERANEVSRQKKPLPTLTLIRAAIASCDRRTKPEEVIHLIAGLFGVKVRDICSGSRVHEVSRARSIASYMLRERLKLTYMQTAEVLRLKNHTSVISAVKCAERILAA